MSRNLSRSFVSGAFKWCFFLGNDLEKLSWVMREVADIETIAFGGGCHWCTEAVFQQLRGVREVEQGWVGSEGEASGLSEGVIVHFHTQEISLKDLLLVHLHTHSSGAEHSMRGKYRSAVYVFDNAQKKACELLLKELKRDFPRKIVTRILPYHRFEPSPERIRNYYAKDPDKPFCRTYIDPKFKKLLKLFPELLKEGPQ
ncbi:peptide-methionine (S)-S-oxide reductase [Luteolibacter sp. AS25]|uniref:peptide-methionine (S)-S-oxide reductase n=1 Tax=Luteolibacter sp. AS25 TaxID=3135776 RepID=UPI00398B0B52